MNRKELINRLEEIMEKGNEFLKEDNVRRVDATYCPICDKVQFLKLVYKKNEVDKLKYTNNYDELSKIDKHSKWILHQVFCDYHKDVIDIEKILKYEELVDKIEN